MLSSIIFAQNPKFASTGYRIFWWTSLGCSCLPIFDGNSRCRSGIACAPFESLAVSKIYLFHFQNLGWKMRDIEFVQPNPGEVKSPGSLAGASKGYLRSPSRACESNLCSLAFVAHLSPPFLCHLAVLHPCCLIQPKPHSRIPRIEQAPLSSKLQHWGLIEWPPQEFPDLILRASCLVHPLKWVPLRWHPSWRKLCSVVRLARWSCATFERWLTN